MSLFIQSAKVRKKVIIAKYRCEKGYIANGRQQFGSKQSRIRIGVGT